MPSTESLESRATRPPRRGSTAATPGLGVTTRSRARAQQESQSQSQSQSAARTKLGEGEADGCKKRAKLDGTSQPEPESSKKGKTIPDYSQDSQSSDWGWGWGEEDEDGSTSAFSSPIRVPVPEDYMPSNGDSEMAKENRAMNQAFRRKIFRQMQLPTLFAETPPNCLVNDPTILHIREPARKAALRAAQFVVGVSSSIDGEPLARCSGFWIDFDNVNNTGTVVTTALLIRTKHISSGAWLCRDQYACDAKVDVDLRGYKGYILAEGHLLYYQKHYNLAFFKVRVDSSVQLPSFSDKVKCAQDIFELGRDEHFNLLINHGRVEYSNPSQYERHHHMYIQGPQRDRMYDLGGPVIDLDGKVVGMIGSSSGRSFIPSSILLKCFHLWRNFQRIPRPHLGLKFNAISLLNPALVEQILVECGIDEGLIVTEVSEDSPAEKCGIRNGDVIECLNGKRISTTVELENMLLSIMENIGDNLNSDLDLEIQVYFTRRDLRRTKVLTVNVSEDGEYCAPYYATRMHFVAAKSYLKMIYIICSMFQVHLCQ